MKRKIIRIATVPQSLDLLLRGQLKMLSETYEVVAVSSPGQNLDEVARHFPEKKAEDEEDDRPRIEGEAVDGAFDYAQGGAACHDGCMHLRGAGAYPHVYGTGISYIERIEKADSDDDRPADLHLCHTGQSGGAGGEA